MKCWAIIAIGRMNARDPTPTTSQRTLQDFEQARTAGNGRPRKPYAESYPAPMKDDAISQDAERRIADGRQVQIPHRIHLEMMATDRFRSWLRWHTGALKRLLRPIGRTK